MTRLLPIVTALLLGASLAPWTAAAQTPDGLEELPDLFRGCVSLDTTPRDRVDVCTELLSREILNDEGRAAALAFRGEAKRALFDYSGALRDFTEALEIEPSNVGVLQSRARVFGLRGEHTLALLDMDEAIQIAPEEPSLYISRAIAHGEMENFDAAYRDLEQAKRLAPKEGDIYNIEGGLRMQQDDYAAAVAAFDRALELRPDATSLYLRRALAKLLNDAPEAALADTEAALEAGLETPQAYLYKGYAAADLERTELAIASFGQAIDLDPAMAVAWHQRGLMHMQNDDYAAAREDLNVAAQIDPTSDYLNSLAWLLVVAADDGTRDPAAALDYVTRSLELDENPDNVDTAAAAHVLLGNREEAMRYYVRSMELGGEERVRLYQEYLSERGYYSGTVDGIDGPNTREAIRRFADDGKILLAE